MPHTTGQAYSISDKICNSGDVVADLTALRVAGFDYTFQHPAGFRMLPWRKRRSSCGNKRFQTGVKVLMSGTLTPKVNLWAEDLTSAPGL